MFDYHRLIDVKRAYSQAVAIIGLSSLLNRDSQLCYVIRNTPCVHRNIPRLPGSTGSITAQPIHNKPRDGERHREASLPNTSLIKYISLRASWPTNIHSNRGIIKYTAA